jgi:isoleucyl-tRNA synthetase
LAKAHLITSNGELLAALKKQQRLIEEELNVKEIEFHAEEGAFVQWTAKPNFPVLGKKIGKLIPQAQKVIGAFSRKQILTLASGGTLDVEIGGEKVTLEPADVQIERKVKEGVAAGNVGELTVALDTALNDELIREGLARELVNKINTMRRDVGLEVVDRIRLKIEGSPRVEECFKEYKSYITGETLTVDVQFGACEGTSWDLNGEETKISIHKV